MLMYKKIAEEKNPRLFFYLLVTLKPEVIG